MTKTWLKLYLLVGDDSAHMLRSIAVPALVNIVALIYDVTICDDPLMVAIRNNDIIGDDAYIHALITIIIGPCPKWLKWGSTDQIWYQYNCTE